MRHWLLKTEPGVFSFDDLLQAPDKTTGAGTGSALPGAQLPPRIRWKRATASSSTTPARNPPVVAGLAEVVRRGLPRSDAVRSKDDHYDPESTPAAPALVPGDVKVV